MDPSNQEVWAIVELMGHVKLAGRLTEEEKFGAKMGRLDIPSEVACQLCGGDGHGIRSSGPDPQDDPCAGCLGMGMIPAFVTQMFGGGSVYRITIVTESVARQVCKQHSPAPVSPWDFPKQLTAPTFDSIGSEEDYDDDDR